MAIDVNITEVFPNYTSDGTNMTIPIADVLNLTAGEAATSGGDYRELFRKMLAALQLHLDGLADADKPIQFDSNTRDTSPEAGTLERLQTISFKAPIGTPDIPAEL